MEIISYQPEKIGTIYPRKETQKKEYKIDQCYRIGVDN